MSLTVTGTCRFFSTSQIKMESMTSLVIQQRQTTLKDIGDFIDKSTSICNNVLEQVGWTATHLQEQSAQETCPVSPGHWMSHSSLSKHNPRCQCAKEGYEQDKEEWLRKGNQQEEDAASGDKSDFNEDAQSIILDAVSQHEIIFRETGKHGEFLPRTMARLDTEFTAAQRLAMYETVRHRITDRKERNDDGPQIDMDLTLGPENKDGDKEKPKSHMQVLAEMRDYRRRRQSYRAKNVHITKKSKTDIMREIIEAHMKFMEDPCEGEDTAKNTAQEDGRLKMPDRGRSYPRETADDSEEPGRSREHSRSRDKRQHSHTPSREGRHARHSSKHKHKHKHRSHDKD